MTLAGAKLAVGAKGIGGSTTAARLTLPENPSILVTLIVALFDDPAGITRLEGFTLRPKPGAVTRTNT